MNRGSPRKWPNSYKAKVTFYLQPVQDGELRHTVSGSREYRTLAAAQKAARRVVSLVGCAVYINQYIDGFGGDCVFIMEEGVTQ